MKKILLTFQFLLLVLIGFIQTSNGQYVHPNQAGRKGGDTGPGKGRQVVTTTYYGNSGNPLAQGVIVAVNKDGTNATALHDFDGYPSDAGYSFYTTPHQMSDGNIYGSSYYGGASNVGAIYKFNLGNCKESVIFNNGFGSASGGYGNYANVNELSDGKIYSALTIGGTSALGTLVRMDKDGSNMQVLHEFKGVLATVNYSVSAAAQTTSQKYDGAYPCGYVVEGLDGKLYGTTYLGGSHNVGAVYRCDKDGTNYEIINIGDVTYRQYTDARGVFIPKSYNATYMYGNVAIDQAGKVYVTGYYGGAANYGCIARMDADGSNYRILQSGSYSEGYNPTRGGLIIDNRIYGTFRFGGGYSWNGGTGYGVVYSMNLDGTDYKKLHVFDLLDQNNVYTGAYSEGADPWGGISYDGTYIYGTTWLYGGLGNVGTIYKVKPNGSGFKTIHRFSGTAAANCGPGTAGMYNWYPSGERPTFADIDVSCSLTCVPSVQCTAGTAAPTLSRSTIINMCPDTTVNLTFVGATNLPAGSEISWHTATPAKKANAVADPTKVTTSGTFYAVIYDPANGCYGGATPGSATSTITVTISKPCCPAGAVKPLLISNKQTNACPATTANLTSLVKTSPPSGSTVTWHTATPATVANKVPDATAVGAGTYYAAYFSSSATCYSPTSEVVTVTIGTCTTKNVSNVCPATGVDLTTLVSGTPPAGTSVTWHTGTPATAANKVANPATAAAGTYYPAYYDSSVDCYGATGNAVVVTITGCVNSLSLTAGAGSQSAQTNEAKTGTASTDLSPTGGNGTYVYSNGSADPACIAPVGSLGAIAVTVTNVNTGSYSYTAPATPGKYHFCIKVCDTSTPTPICKVQVYTVTVTAPGTITLSGIGGTSPTQTGNTNQFKSGNLGSELVPVGGTGSYTYTNGSSDPACVAPSGAMALPATSNLMITNGSYSYTTPATPGTYYFCVKVCDTTSPTPICTMAVVKVIVSAGCAVGSAVPVLKN